MGIECSECAKPFASIRRTARFCSGRCSDAAARRRQRDAYAAKSKLPRPCAVCQEPIPPSEGRGIYCGVECKTEANAIRRAREASMATAPTHAALCMCGTCRECRLTVALAESARDYATRRASGESP
jgi:predicted nucleic acid-binding Zn ribbon protein